MKKDPQDMSRLGVSMNGGSKELSIKARNFHLRSMTAES